MSLYNISRILIDKKKLAVLSVFALFLGVSIVFAQGTGVAEDSNMLATATGKINQALCKLASLIFFTAGAIASLVIIFAGIRWVTSADDPGARNGAKTTIISAFVGLIIIAIAVYIVAVVINGLLPMNVNPTNWISGSCPSG